MHVQIMKIFYTTQCRILYIRSKWFYLKLILLSEKSAQICNLKSCSMEIPSAVYNIYPERFIFSKCIPYINDSSHFLCIWAFRRYKSWCLFGMHMIRYNYSVSVNGTKLYSVWQTSNVVRYLNSFRLYLRYHYSAI